MIAKRYVGYALFAVLVICWLLEIELRNKQAPQIQDVQVEEVEGQSQVRYRIRNPLTKPIHIAAHIRLQPPNFDTASHEFSASPVTVLKHEIQAGSELAVDHFVPNVARWHDADVQLYVLDDAWILRQADLDKLSAFSIDRLQEFFK